MDHPEYQELIAFAAGEFDVERAASVDEHADGCAECSATIARFHLARTLLEIPFESPPPAAFARVYALQRSHGQAESPGWRVTLHSWIAGLELAALRQHLPRLALAKVVVGVVVAAAMVVAGYGVMLAAAQGALPGDVLYPVKTTDEAFRLAISPSAIDKAELHLNYAQNRANEIQALSSLGRFDRVPSVAADYEQEISKTVDELTQASRESPAQAAALLPQVENGIARSSEILTKARGALPEDTKTDVEHAISLSETTVSDVKNNLISATPTSLPALTTRAATAVPSSTEPIASTVTPESTSTVPMPTEPPAGFKPTATPGPSDTPEPLDTAWPTDTPIAPTATAEPAVTPPAPLPQPTNPSPPPGPPVTPGITLWPIVTPGPLGTPVPDDTPGPEGTPGPSHTPDPSHTPRPTHTPKQAH